MHPTTPLGFDWWTTSVVLETEGAWTFRVEGWDDPWETWVHNAEIKIPAGIDVSLVCIEGKALFDDAADRADRGRRQPGGRAAARCGQEPGFRPAGRGPARGRAGRRRPGGDADLRPAPSWSRRPRNTRSSSTAGRRCSRPGTSSSRARRARSTTKRPRPGSRARSTARTSGSKRPPRWASTWSTCRRSTRSAASSARVRTTP